MRVGGHYAIVFAKAANRQQKGEFGEGGNGLDIFQTVVCGGEEEVGPWTIQRTWTNVSLRSYMLQQERVDPGLGIVKDHV
jgi:hypothetical protein